MAGWDSLERFISAVGSGGTTSVGSVTAWCGAKSLYSTPEATPKGPWSRHGIMVCREPGEHGATFQSHWPSPEMAQAICDAANKAERAE